LMVTEWCHAYPIRQLEYTLTNHTRTLTNHVVDRQAKTALRHTLLALNGPLLTLTNEKVLTIMSA
jgi:hypothetical protein